MLTGDNGPTALAIARELGIADPRSGLLPADKAAIITELNTQRGPTGMVGDGVNDAPALAAARVSFAMGGISSASALEAADVVLMADDLAQPCPGWSGSAATPSLASARTSPWPWGLEGAGPNPGRLAA